MAVRGRRVVVAGSIAQRPDRAGHAWVFLQYLLGFRRLGWDVLFLDRLTSGMAGEGDGTSTTEEPLGRNVAWLQQVMHFGDLERSFSLELPDGTRVGRDRAAVERYVKQADLLIDVNGFLGDGDLLAMTPLPVFLDIDPGFNQMWRELGLADVLAGHDAFVTVAQRMGKPDCTIPTCGVSWITTLPPVVLDLWPVAPPRPEGSFTTIATWRGPFAPVEYEGSTYGLRVHEFRRFMELPALTGQPFEVALDIDAADDVDIQALRANGWQLIDPEPISAAFVSYQQCIEASRAEFSVAKAMYVKSRSGWFSDRSACYLATGRPVIVQDTGISEHLPVGDGLLTYSDLTGAAEAIKMVARYSGSQARAARSLAERHLASDLVVPALVRELGCATPRPRTLRATASLRMTPATVSPLRDPA